MLLACLHLFCSFAVSIGTMLLACVACKGLHPGLSMQVANVFVPCLVAVLGLPRAIGVLTSQAFQAFQYKHSDRRTWHGKSFDHLSLRRSMHPNKRTRKARRRKDEETTGTTGPTKASRFSMPTPLRNITTLFVSPLPSAIMSKQTCA